MPSPSVVDHHFDQSGHLSLRQIAGVRNVRLGIGGIDGRHSLSGSAVADARHHDVAENGGDCGGRAATDRERNFYGTVIVELNLRRKGELLLAEVMLQLL